MKVTGTESGGKSSYQGDDGRFYDANHRGHESERLANAHIAFEIEQKESLGINTITGIDGIIILIFGLLIWGTGYIGFGVMTHGSPFSGIGLIILAALPVYPLYKFFFFTYFSTRKVVYLFAVAMCFLINWILTDVFNIHLLK
ncbi:hypothetical protein [Pseudomonas syringae]|uniref:Uncharacterized protein n=1 Tax=Pseudomonas syringae TaxID=317 RepID=A0A085VF48_PSESX|nr:hypothetical protein [Pseudomonas syringae]KFE54061.1 hypothetical protein IV02_04760 [Pseudomonas syringae]